MGENALSPVGWSAHFPSRQIDIALVSIQHPKIADNTKTASFLWVVQNRGGYWLVEFGESISDRIVVLSSIQIFLRHKT
jgi:hypothetical protein